MVYTILGLKRANSKSYDKVIAEFETEEEVINYLNSKGLKCLPDPYVFAYIKLNDNTIIKQKYNNFPVSPNKLRDKLKEEGFY